MGHSLGSILVWIAAFVPLAIAHRGPSWKEQVSSSLAWSYKTLPGTDSASMTLNTRQTSYFDE